MRMTMLVVSFNRHFFARAVAVGVVGLSLTLVLAPPWLRTVLTAGVGLAAYFMVASVIASSRVYDASDLSKLRWWSARALQNTPADGIVVPAGFDPASPAIAAAFPRMRLRGLNFCDPRTTPEASIQRAHRLRPPSASEVRSAASAWSVAIASHEVVFALSAAHELRKAEVRVAFFAAARRVLKAGGQVIVVAQLRDLANFA